MHTSTILCIVSVLILSLSAPAQTILRALNGPTGSQFGTASVRAGDLNGDSYQDLLVGAPGFNQGRGAVYAISGAYIATGGGASILWSVSPGTLSIGDNFGHAMVRVDDLTGDGIDDFVVTAPFDDNLSGTDAGALYLLNGATHLAGPPQESPLGFSDEWFGYSIAAYGDFNADGKTDLAVGAPSANGVDQGALYLVSGPSLLTGITFLFGGSDITLQGLGWSVASGFDINGDGKNDMVCGAPYSDYSTSTNAGAVVVWFTVLNQFVKAKVLSANHGERLGTSIDSGFDYDADGVLDVIAGAPNFGGVATQGGRAVVLSGLRVFTGTPPYEMHSWTSYAALSHFGAAVCASPDINGDGVGEILIGTPDYVKFMGVGNGHVSLYSGASGALLEPVVGLNNEHLGDALLGAMQDYDGDGWREYVIAGSLSDASSTDAGVLKVVKLFPAPAALYCTSKINSLGCTPAMAWSGSASASSSSSFDVTATDVLNQRSGILYYGFTPNSSAFQGGIKCVASPTQRTPMQSSGGSSTGNDCSGVFTYDFNARIQSGIDPLLVAGQQVFCQYWSRDPQSPSTTSLTNAVRFVINP